MFELIAALVSSKQFTLVNLGVCATIILAFHARRRLQGPMNLFLIFFIGYYVILNFSVNSFDLVWNFVTKNVTYKPDDDFTSSFSYRVHQGVLLALLAFVSAQIIRPSISVFREVPKGLAVLHFFSTLVVGSLAVTFLIELTAMAPKARFKVFRVELVKVFMTVVLFYLLSLLFTTWVRHITWSVQVGSEWKE